MNTRMLDDTFIGLCQTENQLRRTVEIYYERRSKECARKRREDKIWTAISGITLLMLVLCSGLIV